MHAVESVQSKEEDAEAEEARVAVPKPQPQPQPQPRRPSSGINIKRAISEPDFGMSVDKELSLHADALTPLDFGDEPNLAAAFWESLMDIASALYIYAEHTVNWEGFLVMLNAIGATVFYLRYAETNADLASKLDFSILAFAVVFPLSSLLSMAFARREGALVYLADFRALLCCITVATLTWDFPDVGNGGKWGGRAALPAAFNDGVRDTCVDLAEVVFQYLAMPTVSRSRNLVIPRYQRRVDDVQRMRSGLERRIAEDMRQLTLHVEVMKAHGMPGNESSRINQYVWFVQQRLNNLRNNKVYRTPQPTRSFGRVYLFVLPWFFGPYFVWVAGLGDTQQVNEPFAIALSALTFLVLLGLINAGRNMEDPFVGVGYDNVHLRREIASLVQTIKFHHDEAEAVRLQLAIPPPARESRLPT